jgi:AcrR family transcriptional regulator
MATPSATRDRILDAALALFSERGFKATTVIDIETAAGLTPGAGGVFHHFPSKRAVLAAALERRFQQTEALDQLRTALPRLGDRAAELRVFARYVLDQLADERDLLVLVLAESRRDEALFATAARTLFADRERTFARWIAGDDDLTDADLALARMALGALAYGPTIDALLGRETPERDDASVEAWVTSTLALFGESEEPGRTR